MPKPYYQSFFVLNKVIHIDVFITLSSEPIINLPLRFRIDQLRCFISQRRFVFNYLSSKNAKPIATLAVINAVVKTVVNE